MTDTRETHMAATPTWPMATEISTGAANPDKIAPNSPEAEQAVLGSILINPDAIFEIDSFLKPAHFFILKNQWVYEAIQAVKGRSEPIDNLTVIDELRRRDKLDLIGGSAYITFLINSTPTHIHAETYGRMVERAAIRRRLLSAAGDVAQVALEEIADIDEVLDQAESIVMSVRGDTDRGDMQHISGVASAVYDATGEAKKSGRNPAGMATGFEAVDRMLTGGGLPKGLCILAARPGMGKTTIAVQMAVRIARAGGRVGFFTIEMSAEQIARKMLSEVSGLSVTKLANGDLTDAEWEKYSVALTELSVLDIFIDDSSAPTAEAITAKSKKQARRHGDFDAIFIDYLGLMTGRGENTNQEISWITRKLKLLSRSMKCPVILLCQLNRKVEDRANKRPMLSDLRDSGSIEQDGDLVLFLYRDEYYNTSSEDAGKGEVIFGKQREGPTSTGKGVLLGFLAETPGYFDLATGRSEGAMIADAWNAGTDYAHFSNPDPGK